MGPGGERAQEEKSKYRRENSEKVRDRSSGNKGEGG